jgi:hypothetical protein
MISTENTSFERMAMRNYTIGIVGCGSLWGKKEIIKKRDILISVLVIRNTDYNTQHCEVTLG